MGDELSDASLRGRACLDCDSLLGDWHVLSAVVPVGTSSITADIVWQGTMIEFITDGSITIAAVPLAVLKTEVGTLILRGENIEIEILKN